MTFSGGANILTKNTILLIAIEYLLVKKTITSVPARQNDTQWVKYYFEQLQYNLIA